MIRAIFIGVCVAALAACGASDQSLVGRWQSEEGGYINQLDLHADGTYTGTLEQRNAMGLVPLGHYSGRWKYRGGQFTGQVVESDTPLLAVGYAWSDALTDLNDASMVLRSSTSHDTTWQRLP